jgi:hypothetical protein
VRGTRLIIRWLAACGSLSISELCSGLCLLDPVASIRPHVGRPMTLAAEGVRFPCHKADESSLGKPIKRPGFLLKHDCPQPVRYLTDPMLVRCKYEVLSNAGNALWRMVMKVLQAFVRLLSGSSILAGSAHGMINHQSNSPRLSLIRSQAVVDTLRLARVDLTCVAAPWAVL